MFVIAYMVIKSFLSIVFELWSRAFKNYHFGCRITATYSLQDLGIGIYTFQIAKSAVIINNKINIRSTEKYSRFQLRVIRSTINNMQSDNYVIVSVVIIVKLFKIAILLAKYMASFCSMWHS